MQVLMIEDEQRVADFVRRGLAAEGWIVDHAEDGETGLELLKTAPYDVILLDLMLPGISGQEFCRKLRAMRDKTPILMLSALDSTDEKVEGLRLGADDYLAKPFDFDELIARIGALHRRRRDWASIEPAGTIAVGPIIYDPASMTVSVSGESINLTSKEREVLVFLMRNAGRLCSRERLLSAVWGANSDPLTNVVDVTVSRLRRKLGYAGARIVTTRNYGYRFE